MCGKCAANLVISSARVRRILSKCAAIVLRIFFNYVGYLCWKAAKTLQHEVSLIILSMRTTTPTYLVYFFVRFCCRPQAFQSGTELELDVIYPGTEEDQE